MCLSVLRTYLAIVPTSELRVPIYEIYYILDLDVLLKICT